MQYSRMMGEGQGVYWVYRKKDKGYIGCIGRRTRSTLGVARVGEGQGVYNIGLFFYYFRK